MFDIGLTELLVIGVVALIVVGPKDLPGMFRTLGRFTAKARSMAREFSRAMEQAADETGVGDMAKDLKKMTSAKSLGLDAMKDAATKFEEWDPMNKTPATSKGPATAALTEDRAAMATKIRDAAAKKASARLAKEAKAKKGAPKPTAKKQPTEKPPAKKAAAKPTAAKKNPAKAKATPRKTAPKKPAKGAAK